jgi:hypothetical protein
MRLYYQRRGGGETIEVKINIGWIILIAVLAFFVVRRLHHLKGEPDKVPIDTPPQPQFPFTKNVFKGDDETCRLVRVFPKPQSSAWMHPRVNWYMATQARAETFVFKFEQDALYCLDEVADWLEEKFDQSFGYHGDLLLYQGLAQIIDRTLLVELWIRRNQNLLPSMTRDEVESFVAQGSSAGPFDSHQLQHLHQLGPIVGQVLESRLERRIKQAQSNDENKLWFTECQYYLNAYDWYGMYHDSRRLFELLVENGEKCYQWHTLSDDADFHSYFWLGLARRLMREDFVVLADKHHKLLLKVVLQTPLNYESIVRPIYASSYVFSASLYDTSIGLNASLTIDGFVDEYLANPAVQMRQ